MKKNIILIIYISIVFLFILSCGISILQMDFVSIWPYLFIITVGLSLTIFIWLFILWIKKKSRVVHMLFPIIGIMLSISCYAITIIIIMGNALNQM